jgi:hypothetical protein
MYKRRESIVYEIPKLLIIDHRNLLVETSYLCIIFRESFVSIFFSLARVVHNFNHIRLPPKAVQLLSKSWLSGLNFISVRGLRVGCLIVCNPLAHGQQQKKRMNNIDFVGLIDSGLLCSDCSSGDYSGWYFHH